MHPVPVIAVIILLLNDHWWKGAFGGPLTGIVSDVAGLAFFPLTLQAGWEVALSVLGRPWGPSRRTLVVAVGLTAIVFSAIQLSPVAGDAYRAAVGGLQAPFRGGYRPVSLTADPFDLFALPALAVAAWAGWRR